MKKLMNVLKKVTVVAVVCMLVASATTTQMYKSRTSIGSQQLISCSAYDVSLCAKDEKPEPEPEERPLAEFDFY